MLRIYISKIPNVSSDKDKEILDNLNKGLQKRVLLAKNENQVREKSYTYALLLKALFHSGYKGEVMLGSGKFGKPTLCDEDYLISLSHTDGLCAVAISDENEVGIDVEKLRENERMKLLAQRFLKGFSYKAKEPFGVAELYLYDYKEDSLLEILKDVKECGESFDLTHSWTAAEALLKCDGGGFSSLASLSLIEKECELYSFVFGETEKYSVTLAVKKL